jgi:predicted hotdog family 3-hydroxylacyl-ACP dehydratase
MSSNNQTVSNQETLPLKAEAFLPHSGVMCVIDDLIYVGDKDTEATAIVTSESPFAREDQTVEECIYIEMIAQTIGAGNGYKLSVRDRQNQEGYLLGVKNFIVNRAALVGEALSIWAIKSGEFGDFGIIEGKVFKGEEILARGEIKVFQRILKEPLN